MSDEPLFPDLGSRQCRRCAAIKPLQEFPARLRANGNVKFDSYCQPCRKAYQHEWYLAHREAALAPAAARREKDRARRPPPSPPPYRRPLQEAMGFRAHHNPRVQGDAGLGVAIAYFSRIGVRVGIPLTDSQPYDLMIDDGERLSRVQVRTTTMKQGRSSLVHLATMGGNKTQVKVRLFDPGAYDWLFVVCGDATAYLIPTSAIHARRCLYLGRKYARFRLEEQSG